MLYHCAIAACFSVSRLIYFKRIAHSSSQPFPFFPEPRKVSGEGIAGVMNLVFPFPSYQANADEVQSQEELTPRCLLSNVRESTAGFLIQPTRSRSLVFCSQCPVRVQYRTIIVLMYPVHVPVENTYVNLRALGEGRLTINYRRSTNADLHPKNNTTS